MHARQDLINAFSSFIQFEGDRFQSWLSDPRLRRSMERQGAARAASPANPSLSPQVERSWAVYWHRQWQQQPQGIAQDHLLAYLQEACYWVAYKLSSRFASSQYGTSDCFQMAIAQLDKVLAGFDTSQGHDLKHYAGTTFRSLIRDALRQRKAIDICTDWSLLRKVSQKRLVAALEAQGLTPNAVEPYRLTWQIYNRLYAPTAGTGSRRMSVPNAQTWAAIAEQFNRERHSLPAEAGAESAAGLKTVTPKQVEAWMVSAAKALRSYLYPGTVSMNATRPGEEGTEYIDSFSDEDRASPMGELLAHEAAAERQQQYAQLGEVLGQAVASLESSAQKLLRLYYSGDLTQTEIADQMGIKQYSISRQLSRIRKALLLELAAWSEKTLHISPSPDLLNHTSAALEEWLSAQYGQLLP